MNTQSVDEQQAVNVDLVAAEEIQRGERG